ncbi:hypothetical protein [Niallia sp. 03133]|uniref:hypothetical protein n=1 Tax=Niallia sp. 03133 TaxID=3458060 RepID=UPI004043E726
MESSFEGLGGICLTLLVGQLLKISWHTSFFVYALAFPIFLALFFFVLDDMKQMGKRKVEQKITILNGSNDRSAYRLMIGYGILLFVIVTIFINYNIQITPLILEKNIGNATKGTFIERFYSSAFKFILASKYNVGSI